MPIVRHDFTQTSRIAGTCGSKFTGFLWTLVQIAALTLGTAGMSAQSSLLNELNTALDRGSAEQRSEILRKVTDLFLVGAESHSVEQVALFDDVIERLTQKIERAALAELGDPLAPIDRAPARVINQLARHDDLSV